MTGTGKAGDSLEDGIAGPPIGAGAAEGSLGD